MSDLANTVMALLGAPGDAAAWTALIAPDATYENLAETLEGRDAVVERLLAMPFASLQWERLDHPGFILRGTPQTGAGGRTFVLTITERDGLIAGFGQQFYGVPKSPATPMVMDASLREKIDTALANKHPMYITYVDPQGRPQMSMRGSILTLGPDSLGLWARASSGLATSVASNPNVALIYRDETARSIYVMAGRARVATDEATRRAIYDAMAVPEQRHDFALLGAALVIDLDQITGNAGFAPTGPIDPINLLRGA